MARPLKSVVASALIAFGVSLLLPALASAADAPWVGTYRGVGLGQNSKGDKTRSGVTVWVQDAGGSTKFTFRFDRVPIIFSRTVPNQGGVKGSMLMRIAVDEPGIRGSGTIVVYPKNGNYMMAGKGAGTALRKQGKGRMGAVRISTGVALPSMDDQVKDLFTAVLTRKPKTSSGSGGKSGGSSGLDLAPPLFCDDGLVRVASAGASAAGDGAEGAQDDPDMVVKQAPEVVFVQAVVVEPASIIDLAEAKPPVTTQTTLTAALLLIVLTGAAAIVSVGPRLRRSAAAAASTDAGRPDTPEEGS